MRKMTDLRQYVYLARLQLRMGFNTVKYGSGTKGGGDKKAAMRMLGLLVLYAVLAGYVIFLEIRVMDAAIAMRLPGMLMQLVALAATMLSLLFCLVQSVTSLYFRKDTGFYAPLPVRSRALYMARLTMIWLPECGVSAMILIPVACVYMARTGFDSGFLLTAVVLSLIIPLIPVALGALLGGAVTLLPAYRKHREGLATAASMIFMLISVVLNYTLGQVSGSVGAGKGAMMSILSGREGQISSLAGAFPPAGWAARALMGDYGRLALLLAVGLAAVALTVLLFGNSYLDTASLSEEASAGKRRREAYRLRGTRAALLRREWREIIRTPVYLLNCAMSALVLPILMTGGMLMGFSRAGEDLHETIMMLVGGTDLTVLAAVITAVFSFMGGMNTACATAVSREGNRHGLMMSLPAAAAQKLRAKVLSGFILAVAGLILPAAALTVMLPELWVQVLKGFIWSLMLSFLFSCLAVTFDALRPKLSWLTETEAVKQNFNQIFSMLAGFAVLGALGFLTYAVLRAGLPGLTWYFTGAVLILTALGCLVLEKVGVKAYESLEA